MYNLFKAPLELLALLAEAICGFGHKAFTGYLNKFDIEPEPASFLGRLLRWAGFYRVKHRTALAVFKGGKFVRCLAAPDGNCWHHIQLRLKREKLGPEFSLATQFQVCDCPNLPTDLGQNAPVPIQLKLKIAFTFNPEKGTAMETIEKLIHMSADKRGQLVVDLVPVTLAPITSQLNPVAVYFRREDNAIQTELMENLNKRLNPMGFQLTNAFITEVILPEALNIKDTTNLELLRQRTEQYNREDFARLVITRMSEGLRAGAAPLSTLNINALMAHGLSEPQPEPEPQPTPPPDASSAAANAPASAAGSTLPTPQRKRVGG